MLVTVVPTLPGYATRLFDIAWMHGSVPASLVYYLTSVLFPTRGTFVEKLISADDTNQNHGHSSGA
ncbi:hypothetical protein BS17DRAFT_789536, partial [Gyrodon lividus]